MIFLTYSVPDFCSQFSSVEDHRQDVMCFCWENGYHGIMADDAEYAMVDPPRYFSAKALKMTFQVIE